MVFTPAGQIWPGASSTRHAAELPPLAHRSTEREQTDADPDDVDNNGRPRPLCCGVDCQTGAPEEVQQLVLGFIRFKTPPRDQGIGNQQQRGTDPAKCRDDGAHDDQSSTA
jgi:hypothetical protein